MPDFGGALACSTLSTITLCSIPELPPDTHPVETCFSGAKKERHLPIKITFERFPDGFWPPRTPKNVLKRPQNDPLNGPIEP